MRILMYSPIFPPIIGGPATQCFNLCKALVSKGEIPIVVTYGPNFALTKKDGFSLYHFRTRYTHTFLDKFLRWVIFPFYILYILKKERIDILHCHSVSAGSFISAVIARILNIPSIIKFAGDWVWETLSTYKLKAKNFDEMYNTSVIARFMVMVEKIGLNQFNKIWVVSDFRRKNIVDLVGSDKKIIQINNCLLLEDVGYRKLNESDQITVISANRYIPHKRIPFMVEVFAEANIPNSKLVLIGGGSKQEEDSVKNTILKFNMKDRVIMKGVLSLEEVYNEFKKASFYISTSIEEGMPNVFIEAMNYGLPIITSDAGGSKEIVLHNKTGFVVDVYDKEDFISKIKKLSLDIGLRKEMSDSSYERSKKFNLNIRINDFINIYRDLLKK